MAQWLKETLEMFNNSDKDRIRFEKWPNPNSPVLNELNRLKIVKITFHKGIMIVTLEKRRLLEMAVEEGASAIILFSNSSDNNCREERERTYPDLRHVMREMYALKKNNKYRPIVLDSEGNPHYALDFYVDNICIIGYQAHPCYPERTRFGLKFLVGDKFCFLRTPDKNLAKDLSMLTELTEPGYKQWGIYFDNVRTSADGSYYQSFGGWEETWMLNPEKIMLSEKIYAYQKLSTNLDSFDYYHVKPCPIYEYYWVDPGDYLHNIGFAYDSQEKENVHPIEHPFLFSEYERFRNIVDSKYEALRQHTKGAGRRNTKK